MLEQYFLHKSLLIHTPEFVKNAMPKSILFNEVKAFVIPLWVSGALRVL